MENTIEFKGKNYTLNQCEFDIFDWMDNAKVGEYTRYYGHFVFHTSEGFISADVDCLDNYIYV